MINNKIISLIFKTAFVFISLPVMYTYLLEFNGDTLAYFTVLSNILIFVVMLIIWIKTLKDVIIKKEYEGLNKHCMLPKGIAMLCITVTFLVYAFLLAEYNLKSNYYVNNLSEHYILPMMMILDYFLFDEKGNIKWYHPLIWVGCALCYLPYIFIRAAIIGNNSNLIRYPYFFLNVDDLGVGGVIWWCIGLLIFFSALAYLYFLFDKLINKRKKRA